jgi:hypothetical protein
MKLSGQGHSHADLGAASLSHWCHTANRNRARIRYPQCPLKRTLDCLWQAVCLVTLSATNRLTLMVF